MNNYATDKEILTMVAVVLQPHDFRRFAFKLLRRTTTLNIVLLLTTVLPASEALGSLAPFVAGNQFLQDEKTNLQKTKSTEPEPIPLGYDDPLLLEFAKITNNQIAKIQAIKREWEDEYRLLANDGAPRKVIRDSFSTRQKACQELLTEEQQSSQRRYNLITSWGPEELKLLERAIRFNDPKFERSQIEKLQSIKKDWLTWADGKLDVELSTDRETFFNKVLPKMGELRNERNPAIRAAIFRLFSESQAKRFTQIEWQAFVALEAVKAFANDGVKLELNFTEKQSDELRKLLNAIDSETERFKAVRLQFESYKTFFNALSEKQKAIWREKLGAPFHVNNLTWLLDFMEEDQKTYEDPGR